MGKSTSLVWRFYERLIDDGRTYAVMCKLCDTQYKFFGNTTNLKSHLVRKHPIQWDLGTGSLDDIARQKLDNADEVEVTPKRRTRIYKVDKNVRYSVSVNTNKLSSEDGQDSNAMPQIEIQMHGDTSDGETDIEEAQRASLHLVEQLHRNDSDEEWLEEDPFHSSHVESYEPKKKILKTVKIKREVTSPPRRRDSSYYQSTPLPRKVDRQIIYRDSPQTKDEYSVFGEYVANKLRKFSAPKTRGNIQQLITTILWQAEYGIYDHADSVKRILSIPTSTATVEADTDTTNTTNFQITIEGDEQCQSQEVYSEAAE